MQNTNFEEAPTQSYALLRKLLPKSFQPIIRGIRRRISRRLLSLDEPFYSIYPYTTTHIIRQQNLLRLAREIEQNKIDGAVVECGVLDGGTATLMAFGTSASGRAIHLFDSWSGLPEASERDGEMAKAWSNQVVGSQKRVVAALKRLGIDLNRVTFHKGWFENTFPLAKIDKIALLHIDADFYESVKLCLSTWVPRLTPRGYIQIDDYSAFVGCRRAVDEFLAEHPELKLQTIGQHTQAFFIQKL